MKNQIITATTFQLKHANPNGLARFKCGYSVGDKVDSPLGSGIITELNQETGFCKVKLTGEKI